MPNFPKSSLAKSGSSEKERVTPFSSEQSQGSMPSQDPEAPPLPSISGVPLDSSRNSLSEASHEARMSTSIGGSRSSDSLRSVPSLRPDLFPVVEEPFSPMPTDGVEPAPSRAYEQLVAEQKEQAILQARAVLDEAAVAIDNAHKILMPDVMARVQKLSSALRELADKYNEITLSRIQKNKYDVFTRPLLDLEKKLREISDEAYASSQSGYIPRAREAITKADKYFVEAQKLLDTVIDVDQKLMEQNNLLSGQMTQEKKDQDRAKLLAEQKAAAKQAAHKRLIKRLLVASGVVLGAGLVTSGALGVAYFATGMTPLALFAVSRNFVVNTAWPALSNFAMDLLAKAAYYAQIAAVKVVNAAENFVSAAQVIGQIIVARLSEVGTTLFNVGSKFTSNVMSVGVSLWERLTTVGSSLVNTVASMVSNMSLKTKIVAATASVITGLGVLAGGVFTYNKVKVERAKPKSLDDLAWDNLSSDSDSVRAYNLPSPPKESLVNPAVVRTSQAPLSTAHRAAQDAKLVAQLAVDPDAFKDKTLVSSDAAVRPASSVPSCCRK